MSDNERPAPEIVRCGECGHTEDIETAEERWAAAYIGGEFKSWICEECWYDGAKGA